MSSPPSRALWFIIRSAACCSDSQSRNYIGRKEEGRARASEGRDRDRDLVGAQDVWKVATLSALPASPIPMPREGAGRGVHAARSLCNPTTPSLSKEWGRKEGKGVRRVPVSPSHWFYGYKWLHCRRSGLIASHNPSPSPLVTRRKFAFIPAIPPNNHQVSPLFRRLRSDHAVLFFIGTRPNQQRRALNRVRFADGRLQPLTRTSLDNLPPSKSH